ncbi:HNH endonuclease [Carnobacterium gallinarum]|uniref:HNH endonuclease n=1 Tax=Carnobacterium gallinarum TaxID=2749 RepID=UPI001B80D901|nr:HNH endonuclease [Carnobacterium gallinarum]
MGSSMWLLLSVLPPDKIKDILKSAKLAKNSGKALDGIHITEKQWKEYKALDKTVGGAVDDIPTAFKQTEFASTYEARLGQTPALGNKKVQFVGARGESLSTLKPPPDAKLESILKNAGVEGVYYKNGVPDFSPFSKAEIEIEYMLGGKGALGSKARDFNFQQANSNLAKQLNDSPNLAKTFGMESGNIKPRDIEKYRVQNNLTWHELNNGTTIQLVPSEINSTFGHIGGVGEINAGAFVK